MKLRLALRRWWLWLIPTVLVLAGLCAGLLYYRAHYISVNGANLARDTQSLDLRGSAAPELDAISQLTELKELDIRDTGITPGDYERLHTALPHCKILWSVPFGDGYVDSSCETISISNLTGDDIAQLGYFPALRRIDASDCRDYSQLLALQQAYPNLEVTYDVIIGGQRYERSAESLDVDTVDPAELAALLPHFPELTAVNLTGRQSDDDALFALMRENPGLAISWDLDFLGVSVNSLATEIDISGIQVEDLEEFEASVMRLPRLEKVVMCGCGISNEEMDALNHRHENVKFVWTITVRGVTLRTDITELMPYQYNLWPTTQEAQDFRYLTDLECLDLGHHKITNCDFVAYMPNLKYLLLGDTRISDLTPLEGLTELIYLEIFLTGVTDYTPLLKLTKLQDLNLCYTRGKAEVVAQLTWVDYIRWITVEETRLTSAEQEMLQEALPDTVLELGIRQSSTGGQWRQTQNYFDMRDILGMHYMTG